MVIDSSASTSDNTTLAEIDKIIEGSVVVISLMTE
jgi:hypothetical protein